MPRRERVHALSSCADPARIANAGRILLDVERQRAVGGIPLVHPEECPAKISCARQGEVRVDTDGAADAARINPKVFV